VPRPADTDSRFGRMGVECVAIRALVMAMGVSNEAARLSTLRGK
jgi:hypothetical protein